MAVLLVVAITIGATLFFTRDSSGPGDKTPTAAPPNASDIASANDTGAISIITSDPTCVPWRTIQSTLANSESKEWGERDPSTEASEWTPQVRAQYEAVGTAMRSAADQVAGLAKLTPHRVMREMYAQFIAYGRAYADSLASYEPKDDLLSRAAVGFSTSIASVCNAIDRGGVAARTAAVPAALPPSAHPRLLDLDEPERFVSGASTSCTAWIKASAPFDASIKDWERLDSGIPATAWTVEQRNVQESTAVSMTSYAVTIEEIGRQAGGVFEDFAILAALYLRAYAAATPSYVLTDSYVNTPGLRLKSAIAEACKAEAG